MRYICILAQVALHIILISAAPQNEVRLEDSGESKSAEVAGKASAVSKEMLKDMPSDALITACWAGDSCRMVKVGELNNNKGELESLIPVKPVDEEMTKALQPQFGMMQSTLDRMEEQKSRMAMIQQQIDAMESAFDTSGDKGFMQNMFGQPLGKGRSFAFPGKGSTQMEATMCPMMAYELGKSQKAYVETKSQLEVALASNAVLAMEKQNLENALAASQIMMQKAQEQAAIQAKLAAEMKSQVDQLAQALEVANAEKDSLALQNAQLETELHNTQVALGQEKETTAELQNELNKCEEEKDKLTDALQEQTIRAETCEQKFAETKAALEKELRETQAQLRVTRRELEDEKNAHKKTKRELQTTEAELRASEVARQSLEVAKQLLEDELADTKTQLEQCLTRNEQLQIGLEAVENALIQAREELLKCKAELAREKKINEETIAELAETMAELEEAKRKEQELTNRLMLIKSAAEKLQAEVEKLQLENAQLMQMILKMRAEQESAMALAAGCPPTYERNGLTGNCYKYVREKTQWKMAQEQCMKDGGNLVSVQGEDEQRFLVDYLSRMEARFDDKYLHLGAFDYHVNGVFKWVNTLVPVEAGPTHWLPSNPRGNGRRCLAFQTWDRSKFGQWADEYCWVNLPFVCEVETAPFPMQPFK